MSAPAVRRGEIWLADLDKRRPVVVLTRDPLGRLLHSVIVGPVTSTVRGLNTEVDLTEADGVRQPSVVNLDNLQLVPRALMVRRVGKASPTTLRAICAATAEAIGCPEP
jgi:mRNA interferase MazF